MAIGLTEEHEALAASVRAFTERHLPPEVVRAELESDHLAVETHLVRDVDEPAEPVERPAYWPALAAQGLLGLHLPEEHGGQGFSLVELAIAVEQFGRALAPGPYVPTVLAGAIVAAAGKAPAGLLAGLADGSCTAAVALAAGLTGQRTAQGLTVAGTVEPVLGASLADLLVVPVAVGAHEEWVVVDAADLEIAPLESLDLTRGVAAVSAADVVIPEERVLRDVADPRGLATVILGAEACGVAGWALDAAAAYAKLREQFGRPIGQFQGIKHLCAWMLVGVERARATVWDAARALSGDDLAPGHNGRSRTAGEEGRAYAAAVAAAVAPDVAVRCAEDCIQVHGGIGYTWEHDAHLYYRRALTLRALVGRASVFHDTVAGLAVAGVRRPMDIELPPEAVPIRDAIRLRVEQLAAMDLPAQRAAMADEGWVTPHLPKPWGRAAAPIEQVVIQQELRRAKVRPVPLMIGSWVVPSLVQYGTPEQQDRFLPPTLRGELVWCQLFSEPGAGSDLAGLSTKAEKVDGGWRITGQKIWTSLAREAQWGICIARTNPAAPKHQGITYFLVDMATPGIVIRPLRECTGDAIFNEVFLDGVFVPDSMVVGPVDRGWQVARNTLANERVGLTTSFQLGGDVPQLVRLAAELGPADIGRLACDEHAFQLLGLRATLKQLSGTDPGATANVRKLVAMEHAQDVTEYGMDLLGPAAALWTPRTPGQPAQPGLRRRWTQYALACRAMTIGGGTTQVNLNVIAERILGLPRDP
jgi:alkylation response protein AidB-like acyl-CoA dehydrogenase